MTIDVDKMLDSKHVTVSTRNTYKATATIGKDTVEAEYYTFESDWWNTKKMNALEKVWENFPQSLQLQ